MWHNKFRPTALAAVMATCLTACSGGGFDPVDSQANSPPVSSADNPSIASLNEVLAAPSSEGAVFRPLLSVASGRFLTFFSSDPALDPSSTFVEHNVQDTSDDTVGIKGGFTGFSNFIGYFNTDNSTVSDSADGRYRTFRQGGSEASLLIPGPGASALDFTSFGVAWTQRLDMGCNFTSCFGSGDMFRDTAAFAFGLMTPAEDVPQSGFAEFSGFMAGTFIQNIADPELLTGNANLQVDFSGNSIFGSLNNIAGQLTTSFPNIALSGSFTGNQITGTATSAFMSGDFVARFFGPNAEEIGGTFAMSGDVTNTAMSGAFAAKQ